MSHRMTEPKKADKPRFEVFRARDGRWAWQFVKRGRATAISPDSYGRKADAITGVKRLMANMKNIDRNVREVDISQVLQQAA